MALDNVRRQLEATRAEIAAKLAQLDQRRLPLLAYLERIDGALAALREEEPPRESPAPPSIREHSGKYRPLWAHLVDSEEHHLKMSFAEIEQILGFPLPASSRKHLPHWHGYQGSAVARAIRDAGWRARHVNLTGETVEFVRDAQPEGVEVPVEKRFDFEMVQIYERAKAELGYTASRFLQMVLDQGGVAAARQLIRARNVSDGFITLWEKRRLDLSVEALVLKPEFAELFTPEERQIARDRLRQHGFDPDASEQ